MNRIDSRPFLSQARASVEHLNNFGEAFLMANRDQPTSDPANSIEEFLCSVCAEELNVDRVSPADNFLELGGDSIAAAICLTQIQAKFAIDIALEDLFLGTLRDVAAAIEAGMGSFEAAE